MPDVGSDRDRASACSCTTRTGTIESAASTVEHTIIGMRCHAPGTHIAQFTIWDGMRALDYLLSRPEVDRERIGCTGNSGGGTHTAYLSALDDRIKVAAPSCYITSWQRLLESIGPQDAEQVFPLFLKDEFDFPDYLYAFGPKPYLILSAIRDFFPIAGARASYQEAEQTFARAALPGHVEMFEADDGHGYTKPRREAAYRWFTRWLQGKENSEPESPVELVDGRAAQLHADRAGEAVLSVGGGRAFGSRRTGAAPAVEPHADRRIHSGACPRDDRILGKVRSHCHRLIRGSRTPRLPRREASSTKASRNLCPALLFIGNTGGASRPAVLLGDGDGKTAAVAEAEDLQLPDLSSSLPDCAASEKRSRTSITITSRATSAMPPCDDGSANRENHAG